MDKNEFTHNVRGEIISTCHQIINEQINYVEACDKLLKLANSIDLEKGKHWNIIRSIDDDFLDTPIGESRKSFSKEFLDKADKEVKDFYPKIKNSLFEACQNIIISLET